MEFIKKLFVLFVVQVFVFTSVNINDVFALAPESGAAEVAATAVSRGLNFSMHPVVEVSQGGHVSSDSSFSASIGADGDGETKDETDYSSYLIPGISVVAAIGGAVGLGFLMFLVIFPGSILAIVIAEVIYVIAAIGSYVYFNNSEKSKDTKDNGGNSTASGTTSTSSTTVITEDPASTSDSTAPAPAKPVTPPASTAPASAIKAVRQGPDSGKGSGKVSKKRKQTAQGQGTAGQQGATVTPLKPQGGPGTRPFYGRRPGGDAGLAPVGRRPVVHFAPGYDERPAPGVARRPVLPVPVADPINLREGLAGIRDREGIPYEQIIAETDGLIIREQRLGARLKREEDRLEQIKRREEFLANALVRRLRALGEDNPKVINALKQIIRETTEFNRIIGGRVPGELTVIERRQIEIVYQRRIAKLAVDAIKNILGEESANREIEIIQNNAQRQLGDLIDYEVFDYEGFNEVLKNTNQRILNVNLPELRRDQERLLRYMIGLPDELRHARAVVRIEGPAYAQVLAEMSAFNQIQDQIRRDADKKIANIRARLGIADLGGDVVNAQEGVWEDPITHRKIALGRRPEIDAEIRNMNLLLEQVEEAYLFRVMQIEANTILAIGRFQEVRDEHRDVRITKEHVQAMLSRANNIIDAIVKLQRERSAIQAAHQALLPLRAKPKAKSAENTTNPFTGTVPAGLAGWAIKLQLKDGAVVSSNTIDDVSREIVVSIDPDFWEILSADLRGLVVSYELYQAELRVTNKARYNPLTSSVNTVEARVADENLRAVEAMGLLFLAKQTPALLAQLKEAYEAYSGIVLGEKLTPENQSQAGNIEALIGFLTWLNQPENQGQLAGVNSWETLQAKGVIATEFDDKVKKLIRAA